jgi:hypothetical protein
MADPNHSATVLQQGSTQRGCSVGLRGKARFIQDGLHHLAFCEVSQVSLVNGVLELTVAVFSY